jgi:hypothetical protein
MRPSFNTPRSVLTWATLDEWLGCAREIERRRASTLRNRQAEFISARCRSVLSTSAPAVPHWSCAIDCSGAAPPIFASRRVANGRMRPKPP